MDDTEGLVNLPLGAREVLAVALLKRQTGNVFRVSLRSKGAVDVRAVASVWDGGGHRNAAGCTVKGVEADIRQAIVIEMKRAIDEAG
jgi:phosphoesterase RecJ-like protein